MSAGTLAPRGRHHRTIGLVAPEVPDEREKSSYAWRSLPLLAAALAISALCVIVAQVWMEISHPILIVFSWYTAICIACQALSVPVSFGGKNFDLPSHVLRVRS